MKKRILLIALTLLLLISLAVPALAAGSAKATVTASKNTAYRGDTVVFTVSVSNVANCKAAGITVSYDSNIFTLVSGECLVSADVSNFSDGVGMVAFSSSKNLSGNVFRFTLKVKSDAKFGASANVGGNVSIRDNTGPISVSVSAAKVTVACKHKWNSWSKVDDTNHTRKCTDCKTVETRAHVYDNGCDRSCNDCNATRTTSHDYKSEWSSTGEYHFHECSICGDWKDDEKHIPGDPATELAPQICTICERVLVAALEHEHELEAEVQSDETGHWYNCAKCEEKAEFAEHVYRFDCDALCDVCGYERKTEVEHTPGAEWVSDETGHWHVCTVCQEKTDMAEHTGELNGAEPKCEICDHSLIHVHSYDEEWGSNVEEHWHECVCGDKQDAAAHTWNEGVVTQEPSKDKYGTMTYTCTICGEKDTAMIIKTETEQDLMPWMIACGALGVMVLAMGISLIVIIAKMNKRATGKYAVK